MKRILFLSLVIIISNKSFSQKKLLGEDYLSKELLKIKLKDIPVPSYLLGNDKVAFNYTIKSKHGIAILPQDNMPCVVADVATIEKMPVLYKMNNAVRIPNGYKIIVP